MSENWTPVRRGKIYCSPACGGRCTHADFLEATKSAKVLVKKLGVGFEPAVRENLGWHYEAVCKNTLRVWPGTIPDRFVASIEYRFIGTGDTPKMALHNAASLLKKELNRLNKVESIIDSVTKKTKKI